MYFDVAKDDDYGKLCNRDPEQLEAGARHRGERPQAQPRRLRAVEGGEAGRAGGVQFDSPWGQGRPGWHIECSCMAIAELLGETLDIHGGGLDLQFPHHENELAQSESCDRQAVRARLDAQRPAARIRTARAKMAGSLGNVLNVADALKHVERRRAPLLHPQHALPLARSTSAMWDWKNTATPVPEGMVETRTAHRNVPALRGARRAGHRQLVRRPAGADHRREAHVRTNRVR